MFETQSFFFHEDGIVFLSAFWATVAVLARSGGSGHCTMMR
jgi:hypothetical protein